MTIPARTTADIYLVWPDRDDETQTLVCFADTGDAGLADLEQRFPKLMLAMSHGEVHCALSGWIRKPVHHAEKSPVGATRRYCLAVVKDGEPHDKVVIRARNLELLLAKAQQLYPDCLFAKAGTIEQWQQGWKDITRLAKSYGRKLPKAILRA